MSKHTPGPWHVVERASVSIEANSEIDHIGPIATVHSDLAYPCSAPQMICKRSANARLIAAAPELLDMLEYLQTRLEDITDIRLADEVIAKARGEG